MVGRRLHTVALAIIVQCLVPVSAFATAGRVVAHQQINEQVGGFVGPAVRFGVAAAAIGDLDDDGITDIAIGSEEDTNEDRGAAWVLFLNADGTVKAEQKIDDTSGGFGGALDDFDRFGRGLAGVGDLDGDNVEDLAVGASGDDDGEPAAGAVWILFLNTDGTVKGHQKISSASGGFTGDLDASDFFGIGLANVGDLDGDGIVDLAVGASGDDDARNDAGAVWILFLHTDGTVKSVVKISNLAGGFDGTLQETAAFGTSVARLGDLDGDGVSDIAVGAPGTDTGGTELEHDVGAVWVVFLDNDGSANGDQEIGARTGNFLHDGSLGGSFFGTGGNETFGEAVTGLGDLDGDDLPDLLVGSPGTESGASKLWALLLNYDGTVRLELRPHRYDSSINGLIGCCGTYGSALATIGDLDGDGFVDTVVGESTSGTIVPPSTDSAWILFHDAPVPFRCSSGPATDCVGGGKGSVTIGVRGENRGFLKWKLKKADGFSLADLGDPFNTTAYTICLFDELAGVPSSAVELVVTAAPLNWIGQAPHGFTYADELARMAGVRQLKLRVGEDTRTSARLYANGTYFPLPEAVSSDRMLNADPGVLVQVVSSDGFCIETELPNVATNTATRFKATTP